MINTKAKDWMKKGLYNKLYFSQKIKAECAGKHGELQTKYQYNWRGWRYINMSYSFKQQCIDNYVLF